MNQLICALIKSPFICIYFGLTQLMTALVCLFDNHILPSKINKHNEIAKMMMSILRSNYFLSVASQRLQHYKMFPFAIRPPQGVNPWCTHKHDSYGKGKRTEGCTIKRIVLLIELYFGVDWTCQSE